MNPCDFLFNISKEYLERDALIDSETGNRYSYLSLQNEVEKVAEFIRKKEYKHGSVIATHLYNGADAVITHLAILHCGLISCLLDPMFKPKELTYYLEDSKAVCLFTYLEPDQMDSQWPDGIDKITISQMHKDIHEQNLQRDITAEPYRYEEKEACLILYTSGSTSKPKGVIQTPHAYFTHIQIAERIFYKFLPEDRLVCFVPFSHGYGSINLLSCSLNAGAALVMMRSFQPQKLAGLIETEGITHLFGVPTHYLQLIRYESIFPKLKKLKAAFSAAAPMNHIAAAEWKEKIGIYIDEGYGLTETSTLILFRGNSIPEPPCNVGKPAKDIYKVDVVDKNGIPVGENIIGEIRVKGDNVMIGYWNRPEETKKKLRDGWFYTGDYAYKNIEGSFVLCGRKTEFVNVAGIKVTPIEVESVINQHEEVEESAVIGVDDGTYGEVVKAYVKLKPGAAITERQLIKFVSERLSGFSVPKYISFVDNFKRNNMGKIDKRFLIEKSSEAK